MGSIPLAPQRAGETYVYRYQYDNAGDTCGGNLLSRKTYAYTTGTPSTLLNTDTYTYGSSAWGDLLTAYNGSGIVYDDAMPCIYRGKTVDWDRAGLISELMDTQTVQYAYSAAGKRLQKDVAGTVTDFIYAGDLLLGWQCGSNELAFLFSSNGDAYGFTYNGTPYYYVKNLQNDVIAIASAAGTIVARYYYDAWGRLLSKTDTSGVNISDINPLRYRSYYYDTESGFYFLQSRYYDPEVGRFISPEPNIADGLFDAGAGLVGYNLYAYCANNPVGYFDCNGEFVLTTLLVCVGVGLVVGGGIGGTIAYKSAKSSGKEGSELFWDTAAGAGKGSLIGGIFGGLIGLTGGAATGAFGVGSIQGTAIITSAATVSAKAVEVSVLQARKSKQDGDNGWQIANDCIDSVFSNSWRILFPIATKGVSASAPYLRIYFTDKVNPPRFSKYLKSPYTGWISYLFAALAWGYAIDAFFCSDPEITATRRRYCLK